MRRAAVLILLLALLGVSTSLGVAWFIGGVQPEWSASVKRDWVQVGRWTAATRSGRGLRVTEGFGYPSTVQDQERPPSGGSIFSRPPQTTDGQATELDIGWPFFAWRAAWRTHPSGYGQVGGGDLEGGLLIEASNVQLTSTSILLPASSTQSVTRLLPLRPIWPGVVFDSAVWSAAWLFVTALLLLPGLVRLRLRLRRNRCTMCGYDLRGIEAPICSECGATRGARGPMLGNRLLCALGAALLLLVIAQITVGAKVASLSHGPNRLHLAARDGDLRGIERALRNGVPVDVLVGGEHHAVGTTPLIWAIAGDQSDAVRLLLEHGADEEVKDENGQPAIVLATGTRNEQVFASLLAKGADPDTLSDGGQPVLYWLIGEEGGAACARHLIDAGADVNITWGPFTLLAAAAQCDDLEIARLLIDAGAHVNVPVQNLPMIAAVKDGHVEMAQLLIDAGAEVARSELDLLRLAVESGNVELVTLLLVHGAPRAVVGEAATPLHVAVARCDTDMVRFLTASGFDPTVRDEHGRTPFEQAIEASLIAGEFDEIVRILDAAVRAWYRDGGDADGG